MTIPRNNANMKPLSQLELMACMHYDPSTGVFTRTSGHIIRPWLTRTGKHSPTTNGYTMIMINRQRYYAHRLAWLYMHGVWPTLIDHINRDRSDNRFTNLREATHSENLLNHGNGPAKGIYYQKPANGRRERWIAKPNSAKPKSFALRSDAEAYHTQHSALPILEKIISGSDQGAKFIS